MLYISEDYGYKVSCAPRVRALEVVSMGGGQRVPIRRCASHACVGRAGGEGRPAAGFEGSRTRSSGARSRSYGTQVELRGI
jgi:hypothetical protein